MRFTPLLGHGQIIKFLLEAGADHTKTFLGPSALHLARITGFTRSILQRLRLTTMQ